MFRPASYLTAATVKSAYEAGLAAIRAGQTEFDLGDITAADSSAVAALLAWKRAALQQGSPLAFRNLPANLHSLADLYGVAELLHH